MSWLGDRNASLLREANDRTTQRMLRTAFSTGSRFNERTLGHARRRVDFGDQRHAEGEGSRLVEEDGIELPQRLKVDSALDDGAVPSRSSDGAKDGQRSAGGDAAGSGNDDDRDRGPDIVGDEKGEYRRAKREIDQVSGQAVGHLLDRRARMLGLLNGFNDLAECGFFSEPVSAHLQAACLVDGARDILPCPRSSRSASVRR